MAIGPSDRNRDLPATFETNPIATSAPARGRSGTPRTPAPAATAAQAPGLVPTALNAVANSARAAGPAVSGLAPVLENAADVAGGQTPRALRPDGSFGLLAPGLSARERGQVFADGVKNTARGVANNVSGAYGAFARASDAVVRPVGEFVAGAAGIEPAKPGLRETLLAAQQARRAAGGAGSNPKVEIAPAPAAPAIQAAVPRPAAPAPAQPAAAAAPAAGDNGSYFIGSDGVRRAVSAAPNGPPTPVQAPGGPVAIAQPVAPPVAPPALAPSSVSRVDPSRTRAGDEVTSNAMREIESQLFRNSFAVGRGSRSARALQGQLTQALAGLAPTLGASADAADARNVQARTSLAQTQAQQQNAALQAGTAQNIAAQRAEAAQRVAEIATGGRPPQLLPTTGGLMRLGPDGQAMPVTGPDGQPVQLSGGGQGIRPDTLFKEFNGRIAAIQADATLSPEVKKQQIDALYNDPLFQGLPPYLIQPGQ